MADTWDGPGDGWREVNTNDYWAKKTGVFIKYDDSEDGVTRYWLREQPVSQLPNEPYTVIRVTWENIEDREHMPAVFALEKHGEWQAVPGVYAQRPDALAQRITGFEVLAQPCKQQETELRIVCNEVRRETAKEVLDRVVEYDGRINRAMYLGALAREFGVEQ